MHQKILALCLNQQIAENRKLLALLEQSYLSDNFGCFNRIGGMVKGNELLIKERRRASSGQLVMLCCDIAGMGNLNTLIGELAVNASVKKCLEDIRQWRGVWFISQLNSGDEFVFIIDKGDIGITDRIHEKFKACGFGGVYAAIACIDSTKDYIDNANIIMELIYVKKRALAEQIQY